MRKLLAVLLLLLTPPVLATSYYVRTDGNDANAGTANTAGGAWATLSKCSTTLVAGDKCLVQAGTYKTQPTFVEATNGTLASATAAANCNCISGSTSITCGSVSSVTAGQFVKCNNSNPGFSWTEVASVSGTTITLVSGYRGSTTASAGALSTANFIQYLGQGTTMDDVVIGDWVPQQTSNIWTLEGGTSCTWSYSKAAGGISAPWTAPTAMHEVTTLAAWDRYNAPYSGRDPYVEVTAGVGACPCGDNTITAAVENTVGSWGQDGSKVYIHPRTCADPDGLQFEAGTRSDDTIFASFTGNYIIVDKMSFEGVQRHAAIGSSASYLNHHTISMSGSAQRLSNVHVYTGRLRLAHPSGSTETTWENVKGWGGGAGVTGTHSGMLLKGVEFRISSPSGLSIDGISGTSLADPIVIDGLYMHRTGSLYWGPGATTDTNKCSSGTGYWNCSTKDWYAPYNGVHGVEFGSVAGANCNNYLTIQNSIFEVTGDGLLIGSGTACNDVGVIIRNNTFGTNGNTTDQATERIQCGNISNGCQLQVYNNLFYGARPFNQGSIQPYGTITGITADYNAYVYPAETGQATPRIWGSSDTITSVRAAGNETHGFVVCASGCTAPGTYNDGVSGLTDVSVSDGSPTNYTPLAGARVVNSGLAAQCPTTDFYGNPRSDGLCDIGAVELQAPAPSGRIYHVRTDGSDTNCSGLTNAADPGSGTLPRDCAFKTPIPCFPDPEILAPGDSCVVHTGTYVIPCTDPGAGTGEYGVLIKKIHGTDAAPITLAAATGETVTLCSGTNVHGTCNSGFNAGAECLSNSNCRGSGDTVSPSALCTGSIASVTDKCYPNTCPVLQMWGATGGNATTDTTPADGVLDYSISNMVISGFNIKGGIGIGKSDTYWTINGVTLQNNHFEWGAGSCDGNDAPIRINRASHIKIDHNLLDHPDYGWCKDYPWINGMDSYGDKATVWTYNTWTVGTDPAFNHPATTTCYQHLATVGSPVLQACPTSAYWGGDPNSTSSGQGGTLNVKACPNGILLKGNVIGEGSHLFNQVHGTGQCDYSQQPDNQTISGNLFIGRVGITDNVAFYDATGIGHCSNNFGITCRDSSACSGGGTCTRPPDILQNWDISNNTFYHSRPYFSNTDNSNVRPINNLRFRDNVVIAPNSSMNLSWVKCIDTISRSWDIDYNAYDSNKTWVLCGGGANYCTSNPSNACTVPTDCTPVGCTQGGRQCVGGTYDGYGCANDAECTGGGLCLYECSCQQTTYSTLATWKTNAKGLDQHARADAGGCGLTNPGVGDYSLATGPCRTAGSNGGKVGWEGSTSCVGYTCPQPTQSKQQGLAASGGAIN